MRQGCSWRWRDGDDGGGSSSNRPLPQHRRATVVTETSTRVSIASSSNKLSCDGHYEFDDSERGVCSDNAWDTSMIMADAAAAAVAVASNKALDTSNATSRGEKQMLQQHRMHHRHQLQEKPKNESKAAWNSKSKPFPIQRQINHHIAHFSFSNLFTTPPTPAHLPWRKRRQHRDQQQQIHESIRSSTTTTATTSAAATTTIMQESKLRKKIQHHAQRNDWDSIRNLLKRHPFSHVIPEEKKKKKKVLDARRGSIGGRWGNRRSCNHPACANDNTANITNTGNNNCHGGNGMITNRRPSYGSYSSGRRSFLAGSESAATAAVMAAMLDCESNGDDSCCEDEVVVEHDIVGKRGAYEVNEGVERGCCQQHPSNSASRYRTAATTTPRDDRPDIGENILHDLCRYQPPLDVLETILLGLRERYQGELYTIGRDSLGRTPLHVAAASGAHSTIVDALVRLEPTPASMGDVYCRSPLHLAMSNYGNDCGDDGAAAAATAATELPSSRQNLLRRGHWLLRCPFSKSRGSYKEGGRKSSERTPEEIFRIVQVLKEAMLTYPGKIDFNDEDSVGYSPLDYAIDRGMSDNALIRTLIQRNGPSNNGCCSLRCSDSLRSVHFSYSLEDDPATASATIDNNMEFLQTLVPDEMEALLTKIHKLNPVRRKKWMEYELFKLLVDNEAELLRTSRCVSSVVADSSSTGTATDNPVVATATTIVAEGELPSSTSCRLTCCQPVSPCQACHDKKSFRQEEKMLTYEDIYNKHLQDYFDGYMHELDVGNIQHYDHADDGFDIFVDPEEMNYEYDQHQEGGTANLPINDVSTLPLGEISVVEDDDCVSVLSVIMM